MSENIVIDPAIKALMEDAAIGEAARLFLNSDLGRWVINRATEECDEAMAKLIDVDPTDYKAVAELQQTIRVSKGSITWLAEAMSQGENALRALHEEAGT